ncbi:hypothetical protein B0H17DRAFT_1133082 [Mycena rosella]|uniref:Uncharacterized protein n=1 Tax=Mycena rosella TaxID=1033263 RepID=A0AAD7GIL4_MYCRO|nr:hypothetical protein B0H17DRAFT_1133082 [Mycena rosella]
MARTSYCKVGRLDKAVIPYAAKLRVSPQDVRKALLHEQYISDEASGPEDDDDTSKAVWKTWMAFKHGYDNGSSNGSNRGVVEVKPFLEVMKCDWRAEEMSNNLHAMAKIVFDALNQAEGRLPLRPHP